MSYADNLYMTSMFIAVATVVVALMLLASSSLRKYVSIKLVLAALIIFFPVQIFIFMALDQLPEVGLVSFVSGDFMCAGIHGAGYRTDCSLYEVIFEGVILAVIFSFASFGLVPLAVFAFLLLFFAAVKRFCSHE